MGRRLLLLRLSSSSINKQEALCLAAARVEERARRLRAAVARPRRRAAKGLLHARVGGHAAEVAGDLVDEGRLVRAGADLPLARQRRAGGGAQRQLGRDVVAALRRDVHPRLRRREDLHRRARQLRLELALVALAEERADDGVRLHLHVRRGHGRGGVEAVVREEARAVAGLGRARLGLVQRRGQRAHHVLVGHDDDAVVAVDGRVRVPRLDGAGRQVDDGQRGEKKKKRAPKISEGGPALGKKKKKKKNLTVFSAAEAVRPTNEWTCLATIFCILFFSLLSST